MKESLDQYREDAMGALMDEHERALNEYLNLLEKVTQEEFVRIIDPDTKDEDCRSIQTISTHVVNAAYGYCYYIRNEFIGPTDRVRVEVNQVDEVRNLANKMFEYMLETVKPIWNIDEEELISRVIKVPWGQQYDLEELLEHSIVHILRHRRQIEKFLIKIGKT